MIAMRNQKGFVLIFVLCMIVVLITIFNGFLVYSRVKSASHISHSNKIEARYAAEAGVEKCRYFLSGEKTALWRCKNYQDTLDTKAGFIASVENYGGYIRITSIGFWAKARDTVMALLGECMPVAFDPAITLNKKNTKLVIGANNRIAGDVCLVQNTIEAAAKTSYRFTGGPLINGAVIQREEPDTLNDSLVIRYIGNVRDQLRDFRKCDTILHHSLDLGKTASTAFLRNFANKSIFVEGDVFINNDAVCSSPVRLYIERSLHISGTARTNWLSAFCGGSIVLDGESRVDNAIFYARNGITIANHAQVSAQLLSEGMVIVSDAAHTHNPAFIYALMRKTDGLYQGGISITSTEPCEGVFVATYPGVPDNEDQVTFYISPKSVCSGVVYNNGIMEFRGTITGHCTTKGFYRKEGETSFYNWLFNTVVDRVSFSSTFALPVIFSGTPLLKTVSLHEN
ncbi:MAG: hypothetical protein A2268_12850 [Candidatus Raymondbacteria bacterium RifOxyA12_full_50_37]|uniref:Type 4 fimbrial biogenesis protein PilX N-terminal domain-containing protein n=1 Tax=Candidatus Raymondbacteria bacterium RIFOXYD12_FULL_49_13 TaxID=1817890 RepID=A0A1F7FJP6_UNCRA|nr:MAG: hypothetical protein A2268_12850 [Candidatus Raymondbacteria bacterium RifOxyA12_full_50_37]OGJ90775.1 MAG: hypothetical protein A2248_02140 [Candidatus Raymondbacteria bacterium RIFOXYA2_FULL_49_16]OGJ91654.1 MAG: hypothetical protein A2350_00425 [Candidatus Raymondbacteria bacterium RifOxyB12_full_50_8]OGJ97269.1 MAG: hypothetical protein A2487_16330 [Candidatus Raymondbacteria bacterium RifOxyC12_full_50_8]OGJ97342.1 MAG: hypothetical protein A2453_03420 [Candidatus Raymondbacteria b